MFRVRVALISAGLVAVVTALVYLEVQTKLDAAATGLVESSVHHAQQQILRSSRLEAVDLMTLAAGFAREDEFARVFSRANEDERRKAAALACDGHNGRLDKEGHKAGIIGVVDATGKLVARDLSFNWRYGEDLTKDFPSLGMALTGQPNKDVWEIDGAMYRVGAAAVRNAQGQVVGGLFVGYVQSAHDANEEADRSGVTVAYFYDSRVKNAAGMKIHASSFKRTDSGTESAEEKALAELLFSAPQPDGSKGLAAPAMLRHEATPLFRVKIAGEEWVAAAAPLLGNVPGSTTKSGFVVLASLTQARAPYMNEGLMVLALGLLAMLATLAAAVLTSRRFLQPLDKIEAGVTEVINGNRDFVFESPSPDFEGLANGLNVMLARLLGRPEPGEEDESEEGAAVPQTHWRGDSLFVDEEPHVTDASAARSPDVQALADEPEDAYYARIYREYLAARQQTGEGIDGLEERPFIAKLRQNEGALAKKYNARAVRFKVVVKNNQTTLKPVPLL